MNAVVQDILRTASVIPDAICTAAGATGRFVEGDLRDWPFVAERARAGRAAAFAQDRFGEPRRSLGGGAEPGRKWPVARKAAVPGLHDWPFRA
jgi:hypothetical protein